SNIYKIKDGYIQNIKPKTSVTELKNNIIFSGYTVTLQDKDKNIKTSGKIGTGMKMIFSGNGKNIRYTLIVSGDITGEGNLNSRDKNALMDYLLGKSNLTKAEAIACNLKSDKYINTKDLVLLSRSCQ
ncbi:MAG: hypothetical protein ACI4QE_04900, partial [Acutalibacteraceae bacterium]